MALTQKQIDLGVGQRKGLLTRASSIKKYNITPTKPNYAVIGRKTTEIEREAVLDISVAAAAGGIPQDVISGIIKREYFKAGLPIDVNSKEFNDRVAAAVIAGPDLGKVIIGNLLKDLDEAKQPDIDLTKANLGLSSDDMAKFVMTHGLYDQVRLLAPQIISEGEDVETYLQKLTSSTSIPSEKEALVRKARIQQRAQESGKRHAPVHITSPEAIAQVQSNLSLPEIVAKTKGDIEYLAVLKENKRFDSRRAKEEDQRIRREAQLERKGWVGQGQMWQATRAITSGTPLEGAVQRGQSFFAAGHAMMKGASAMEAAGLISPTVSKAIVSIGSSLVKIAPAVAVIAGGITAAKWGFGKGMEVGQNVTGLQNIAQFSNMSFLDAARLQQQGMAMGAPGLPQFAHSLQRRLTAGFFGQFDPTLLKMGVQPVNPVTGKMYNPSELFEKKIEKMREMPRILADAFAAQLNMPNEMLSLIRNKDEYDKARKLTIARPDIELAERTYFQHQRNKTVWGTEQGVLGMLGHTFMNSELMQGLGVLTQWTGEKTLGFLNRVAEGQTRAREIRETGLTQDATYQLGSRILLEKDFNLEELSEKPRKKLAEIEESKTRSRRAFGHFDANWHNILQREQAQQEKLLKDLPSNIETNTIAGREGLFMDYIVPKLIAQSPSFYSSFSEEQKKLAALSNFLTVKGITVDQLREHGYTEEFIANAEKGLGIAKRVDPTSADFIDGNTFTTTYHNSFDIKIDSSASVEDIVAKIMPLLETHFKGMYPFAIFNRTAYPIAS